MAGLPTLLQIRRTGAASVPRHRDPPRSPQWRARLLAALGFACAVAAPLADLAGLDPIPLLDRAPLRTTGVVLVVVGIAATLAAQLAMGASWRPDVDPTTRTALVTSGPFRLVRNPIFTATAAGLALLVPNLLAAAMLVAFLAALQLQVRLVERALPAPRPRDRLGAVRRTDRTLPPRGRAAPPRQGVGVGTDPGPGGPAYEPTRDPEPSHPHPQMIVDSPTYRRRP